MEKLKNTSIFHHCRVRFGKGLHELEVRGLQAAEDGERREGVPGRPTEEYLESNFFNI